jgi:hypothetical protein
MTPSLVSFEMPSWLFIVLVLVFYQANARENEKRGRKKPQHTLNTKLEGGRRRGMHATLRDYYCFYLIFSFLFFGSLFLRPFHPFFYAPSSAPPSGALRSVRAGARNPLPPAAAAAAGATPAPTAAPPPAATPPAPAPPPGCADLALSARATFIEISSSAMRIGGRLGQCVTALSCSRKEPSG